ncbi:MAG: metal ABC transporter substrate-binding protein [Fidelibacterota bacterium]
MIKHERLGSFRAACLLISAVILVVPRVTAKPRIDVVTTLPDLAVIVQAVGGDRVAVYSIARGYQDPHFVDAKPSHIMKLQRADLFIQIGLDLEIGWAPSLLEGARNPNILWGARGYVDASKDIPLLQVPTLPAAQLRAEGDIHIYGNPHYWLDPENGKIIARNILEGLVRISPDDAPYFRTNLDRFTEELDTALEEWMDMMRPYGGTRIIAFHNSWPYFETRFGVTIAGFVEPKPGISPTPKHVMKTIEKMKREDIRVIIISPYYSPRIARRIVNEVGGLLVELAPSVEGARGVNSYFDLFDHNIRKLVEAFEEVRRETSSGGSE